MTYATIDDLLRRYGELAAADVPKAEVLLDDASAIVQMEGGKAEGLTEVEASVYKGVVCDMVNAFMTQKNWGDVSQHTQSAGPFAETFSFRTPPGALRLTIPQRKLLGLNKMTVGTMPHTYGATP